MSVLSSYLSCSDNFGVKSLQHKRVHNNDKKNQGNPNIK